VYKLRIELELLNILSHHILFLRKYWGTRERERESEGKSLREYVMWHMHSDGLWRNYTNISDA
jgi:hypothetical protein